MALLSATRDTDVMAEINITPFTDVLLVLLIIFMILAALVTPPGFQKSLARGGGSPPAPSVSHTLEVLVSQRGVIFVDGQRTDVHHVYADLASVRQRRGNVHVSITADEKAPYGIIVRILDAAKAARLDDVGFVTS